MTALELSFEFCYQCLIANFSCKFLKKYSESV